MKFVALKNKWIGYANVVGDMNLIHRDDGVAEKVGLEGVVAPGMWLASHIQGTSRIQRAEFGFKSSVYDHDFIEMRENSFYRNEELVCKGNVVFGEPSGEDVRLPEEIVYSRYFCKNDEDVKGYLDSINFKGINENPEMFLMSLSASSLLEYAESKNLFGIHAYQSMEVCMDFDVRDVAVHIKEEKIGKRMCKFDLYWESSWGVVASGKAKVLPVFI